MHYTSEDINCAKAECDLADLCYRCIADLYVHKGSILNTSMGPRCGMTRVEKNINKELLEYMDKKDREQRCNCDGGCDNNCGEDCKCGDN